MYKATEALNDDFEDNVEESIPDSPADAIKRLTHDLRKAALTMTVQEIRFLVDGYYMLQEYRKASGNQVRALNKSKEPHEVMQWLYDQALTLESQIKRALDAWTEEQQLGRWLKSITGVGPVIAAGLMANIDIKIAVSASHLYSFAGLDPTKKWNKGEKRPWNADLKRLCFIIGDSFVKQSGRETSHYGKLYFDRKDYEQRKNEAGDYADQAKNILETNNFRKDTVAGSGSVWPGVGLN